MLHFQKELIQTEERNNYKEDEPSVDGKSDTEQNMVLVSPPPHPWLFNSSLGLFIFIFQFFYLSVIDTQCHISFRWRA